MLFNRLTFHEVKLDTVKRGRGDTYACFFYIINKLTEGVSLHPNSFVYTEHIQSTEAYIDA